MGVVIFHNVKLMNEIIVGGEFFHVGRNYFVRGSEQRHSRVDCLVNSICATQAAVVGDLDDIALEIRAENVGGHVVGGFLGVT